MGRARLWVSLGVLVVAGCRSHDPSDSPSLSLTRWFGGVPAEPSPSTTLPAVTPSATPDDAAPVPAVPRVSLSGETRAAEAIAPNRVPLYARAARAWIY